MTPAIVALSKAGRPFKVKEYEHDPAAKNYALAAVEHLGLDPKSVFKTLVVELSSGELVCALVSAQDSLDFKAISAVAKAKGAALADAKAAQRSTGYLLGGISPFGQKKRLRTFVDLEALKHDTIWVSAGQRGVEIGIAPMALVEVLDATTSQLTRC